MGKGRRWEGGGGGTTAPSEGCSAEGTVMQRPTGGRKLSINPRNFSMLYSVSFANCV